VARFPCFRCLTGVWRSFHFRPATGRDAGRAVNLTGNQPVASRLRKVAEESRNVIGMGFQPGTGDFYFPDSATDGPGADGDEPPQAEEIDRIAAADCRYPNRYVQYRTGARIVSGCVQLFFVIRPIANGALPGSESEGATWFDFAPVGLPDDFNSGNYLHFSENSQDGVCQPIGIRSTAGALYIADYGAGVVCQVSAARNSSEPGSALLTAVGIAAFVLLRRIHVPGRPAV
jgi:MYXO-CTERM domain-containing protein